MTTTLKMLSLNQPLAQWRKFEAQNREAGAYGEFGRGHSFGWNGSKGDEKIAQSIFTQLSHPETAQLVAREFELYSPEVRLRLRTLCQTGNASGNVRKGVQKLNELLKGKLLREDEHVDYYRKQTKDGWQSKAVNPAVAGATRKYGIVKK